MKGKRRRWKKK